MTIDIPSLVLAAGGEIVGKVRLQKMVYLLDQIGLKSGFTYDYHHYGPYSEKLAEQVEDDCIFGRLESQARRRATDGVPYVIFRATTPGDEESILSLPAQGSIRALLPKLNRTSVTVLELAATAHWIAAVEKHRDWRHELARRKGAKTQNGRAEEALDLLRVLGLPPASSEV